VRLLAAACIALGCGHAWAQTAPGSYSDPLAPKLQTDPRSPPRFQRFGQAATAQSGQPQTFTRLSSSPAASGAGTTGFDSTNSRKTRPKRTTKKQSPADASTTANVTTPADAHAIAPGVPLAVGPSPYQEQKPAADTAKGAYASASAQPVDVGPIRKPLKKRKVLNEIDDPYAPLGIHAGAFDLFPAIELIGGYNTNPGQEPNGKGAALYTVAPEMRVQSNWSRHEFKADLRGSFTGYSPDETPSLSRPYFNGTVAGRVDVTRDTRIDLTSGVLVSTDNPNSPNLQAGLAKLPVFATYGGGAGIGQRFNRLDVSLKGAVERTSYQNSSLTDGSTASNKDRDYNQYGVILRGGYDLSPGVTPFVEIGADTRVHDLNTDFSGYQRDSKGIAGSVGTTFEITRVLTGDVSVGYVQRTYEDPRLSDINGLIGNASLIWNASALTTVKLAAVSTVGESTIAGVPGVFYRDVGLQVDHAFRRWLIGTVKAGVGYDTYENAAVTTTGGTTITVPSCNCAGASTLTTTPGETVSDRNDTRFSVGVGLTYKVDRTVQVKGEFRQDWLKSNVSGVDYTASIFLVGLRWQE
jgi:hypothetical protein